MTNLKQWSLEGSIGVKYNSKSALANLVWQHSYNDFSATISAPLSLSSMKIVGHNTKIILLTSDGKKIVTTKPELTMQQQFGWSLPISSLQYWAKALPAPNTPYQKRLDPYNHLALLKQQGWVIYYSNFTVVNNIDLPTTIIMGNYKNGMWLKLAIRGWKA